MCIFCCHLDSFFAGMCVCARARLLDTHIMPLYWALFVMECELTRVCARAHTKLRMFRFICVPNSVPARHMWAHLYEKERKKKSLSPHLILLIRTPNSPLRRIHKHTHRQQLVTASTITRKIRQSNQFMWFGNLGRHTKIIIIIATQQQSSHNNNNNNAIEYMKGEEKKKIVVIKAIYTNNTCYYEQY